MFAKAWEVAAGFTRPVALSQCRVDGKVECSLGAFVIVNAEGWVLTASHLVAPHEALRDEVVRVRAAEADAAAIDQDPTITAKEKARRKRKLRPAPDAVKDYSYWWGQDGVSLSEAARVEAADIAVVKLNGLDMSGVPSFPRFKDPATTMKPGRSLCRLGYPFHVIDAVYDEQATPKAFRFPAGAVPPPLFPSKASSPVRQSETEAATCR